MSLSIVETSLDLAQWNQISSLLSLCFPKPPADVFERVVALSHRRQRLWIATEGETLLGIVMLSPHSKGGHLENLSVAPSARSAGLGSSLVQRLLDTLVSENMPMITLTTRIPDFFESFGFRSLKVLDDGSTAMIHFL